MGKIRHLKIYSSKILRRRKILIYSDLHLGTLPQGNEEKALTIKELSPDNFDFIVIPGDIVHNERILNNKETKREVLLKLRRLLGDKKTYISLGNHDQYMRILHDQWGKYPIDNLLDVIGKLPNAELLTNESLIEWFDIELRAVNNSYEYYERQAEHKEAYLAELQQISHAVDFNPKKYSILLTHDPKSIYRLSKETGACIVPNTDLVISGHMHNGFTPNHLQKLLKGRGIISPDYTLFPEVAYGTKQIGDTIFLTNGAVNTSAESKLINNLFGLNCTILELHPTDKPKKLTYKYK